MSQLGFWAAALAEPSHVAIVDDDGAQHLAGDVLARVNRQTHALRSLGLREGDTVAVCLGVRPELLELYMATQQSGWYFAPIPYGSAPAEIAHMLADSSARAFFFDAGCADAALGGIAQTAMPPRSFAVDPVEGVELWRSISESFPAEAPERPVAGAPLIYTSGTTGLPRAVRRPLGGLTLEHVGKIAAAHLNAVARIRPHSGACHLVSSPLHHSASLLWCVDHLHLGHTVSLLKKWAPELMLERIERDRVTGSLLAPIHFHRLLTLPEAVRTRYDVSSLRHVVHTGAECPVPIKRQMLDWWGPVIYEVYGATEGGGTRVGPEEWLERPGTVGRGFGRIRILRDDGSRCSAGEPGRVFIRFGARRFEYQSDKEKTELTRRGNHFTVGDIGYLDADDYLFLCGRSSDVVISGGVNIYPAQIESVLALHPAVFDVAVFGVPDPEWGEQLKAVIAPTPGWIGDQTLVNELKAHCRSHLAALKCPRTIDFAAALPRGENGKLYKKQLREASRQHSDDAIGGAGPANATGIPEMTGWAKAMGVVTVSAGVERVTAELRISDVHRQAFGDVHGGVYCGLVETVASMGAWLVASARGQSVVGLENTTSFIKTTKSGVLRATATPVTRGRKTQVWEATVRNADEQIVAIGRVRFLCLEAPGEARA